MNEIVNLTTFQVFLIGLVASLLVALVNWLAQAKQFKWFGKIVILKPVHLGRFWLTLILLIVAGGLGYWWFPFTLPALPVLSGMTFVVGVNTILDYIALLIKALTPYFGAAVLLYNLLLSYVTDPAKRKQAWQDIKTWFLRRLGFSEPV